MPGYSQSGELESTVNIVMDERIVPSIRRVNHQRCVGGLEAHQGLCIMTGLVLPIPPYELRLALRVLGFALEILFLILSLDKRQIAIPCFAGTGAKTACDDRRNRYCEP